ncbi:hypothetical protein BT93_L3475 [Corymbia citriodora subsp. variegata]|uniref:Secreted protein n=1 Tax=Corymbia citriodora subsp. variegata TaxID=360336 RepID=A0A8T0CVI2_CORYI|nr:hypothetical protein BT93_L3475 [Corymbia citriodora subsp. variegata]
MVVLGSWIAVKLSFLLRTSLSLPLLRACFAFFSLHFARCRCAPSRLLSRPSLFRSAVASLSFSCFASMVLLGLVDDCLWNSFPSEERFGVRGFR